MDLNDFNDANYIFSDFDNKKKYLKHSHRNTVPHKNRQSTFSTGTLIFSVYQMKIFTIPEKKFPDYD